MILIVTALALGIHYAGAQYVTYNHDETKMNQVTVMETGAGSLTPALFYSLIHNKYYRTASATNKLSYRSTAGGFAYSQVGLAEKVDTSLTKRAEIEALNMADRQVDLAWNAEEAKIQKALTSFQANINRIYEAGGNASDTQVWQERLHLFQTGVSAVRDGYMPNAQRKRISVAPMTISSATSYRSMAGSIPVLLSPRHWTAQTGQRTSPPRRRPAGRKTHPLTPTHRPWQTS